jgi:hypothetical protein
LDTLPGPKEIRFPALRGGRQLSILSQAEDPSYGHVFLRLIPAPFLSRAGGVTAAAGDAENDPWSFSARTQYSLLPAPPAEVLNWEKGSGKSYLIPALDISGFILGDRLSLEWVMAP